MPAINILNLIEKQTIERAIYLVKHLKHIVEVGSFKTYETFIIKIGISETIFVRLKYIKAKRGLATTSHTDYNLCHIAV